VPAPVSETDQFKWSFSYSFPETAEAADDGEEFDLRNATCSYFTPSTAVKERQEDGEETEAESVDGAEGRGDARVESEAEGFWSFEGCETVYNFQNSTVECLCDYITDSFY